MKTLFNDMKKKNLITFSYVIYDVLGASGSADYFWYKLSILKDWDKVNIYNVFNNACIYLDEDKRDFSLLIRYIMTYSFLGPDLFDSMVVLGKDRCCNRLSNFVNKPLNYAAYFKDCFGNIEAKID
ncbi:MAG: hypothetical protein Q7R78_00085 [bacterium]|nr:hypothetical protein [bacterium]